MKLARRRPFYVLLLAGLVTSAALACSPRGGEGAARRGEEHGPHEEQAAGSAAGEHEEETHEEGVVELSPQALANAGIKIVRVEARPLAAEIDTTGEVGFNEDRVAHVGPRVAGRITAVHAALGQRVGRGEALAVIDSVELGQAKADYLQARAQEELRRATYERESRLAAEKISSQKEVLEARAADLEAQAALRSAEEKLRLFGLTPGQIRSLRGGGAGASLLPVPSPFAGTVVEKEASVGEVVGPERMLFTIADLARLWIWIDVFEKDLRKVHLDDGAAVEVDAFPGETFAGKVSFLSAQVDPQTRRVRARIDVDNGDGRLRPGMFGRVRLSDPHLEGGGTLGEAVPTVPERALQRQEDGFVVFVAAGGGRFERRPVRTGRRSGEFVEVLEGVRVGEAVVVEGVFLLATEASKEGLGEGHAH